MKRKVAPASSERMLITGSPSALRALTPGDRRAGEASVERHVEEAATAQGQRHARIGERFAVMPR